MSQMAAQSLGDNVFSQEIKDIIYDEPFLYFHPLFFGRLLLGDLHEIHQIARWHLDGGVRAGASQHLW